MCLVESFILMKPGEDKKNTNARYVQLIIKHETFVV